MPTSHSFGTQIPVYVVTNYCLSHAMMCRLVLPFLCTYEVVLTTRSFFSYITAYDTCQSEILKWHHRYQRKERFVCDPAQRVVRTSGGSVVYPGLEFQAHHLVNIQPTSIHAVSLAVATVDTDIDSVVCSDCEKTCHYAEYCWRRLHDEGKLFKRMGTTAANNWGCCWDDVFLLYFLVCSKAFGYGSCGGVDIIMTSEALRQAVHSSLA